MLESLDEFSRVAKFMLSSKLSLFSCDVETSGLDEYDNHLLGIGFSWKPKTAVYLPWKVRDIGIWATDLEPYWKPKDQEQLQGILQQILTRTGVKKVFHNILFDAPQIKRHLGFQVEDTHCSFFYGYQKNPDTSDKNFRYLSLQSMVAEHGYDDLSHLKDIWGDIKKKEKSKRDLSLYRTTEQIAEYCCGDCDATIRLGIEQTGEIAEMPFHEVFYRRLMPTVSVFFPRMKTHGVRVNIPLLKETLEVKQEERTTILKDIQSQVGSYSFNPNSDKHLQLLFFRKLGLEKLKGDSLDESVLKRYHVKHNVSIAGDILKYRKVSKLIGTYLEGVLNVVNPVTGRVHPDWKPWGAETGRPSCENPNLQNLPSRDADSKIIKELFIPDDGNIFTAGDYSQIELRLVAWYSQDPTLLDAYRTGKDIHALTASGIFGVPVEKVTKHQRGIGKTVNFLIIYGGKAGQLTNQLGNKLLGPNVPESKIIDRDILKAKAQEAIDAYFRLYPNVLKWRKKEIAKAIKNNGYVQTSYGTWRRIPIEDLTSEDNYTRQHAENQVCNVKPQGTAAQYLLFRKQAILEVADKEFWVQPAVTVHDQMVFEHKDSDPVRQRLCRIMETVGVEPDETGIGVPMVLEPDSGYNLAEVA